MEALAQAPGGAADEALGGPGYYSRARNLQKAARLVAQQGGFPQSYEGLLALPELESTPPEPLLRRPLVCGSLRWNGNVLRWYPV